MIISPPFLPAEGLTTPAEKWKTDPMMDKVDGFELSRSGVFPIAFDRRWHPGMHLVPDAGLGQNEPVRAIADGEVVAYRVAKNAISDGHKNNDGTEALNSNTGFVLLKHTTETGEGRTITFYSLYMHLRDLSATQALIPQSQASQASQESSPGALPVWLLTETDNVQLGGSKKVYRKDQLGYVGKYQGEAHLHFEIFMTEADFTAWFEQDGYTVGLGDTQPSTPASRDYWGNTYYVIPKGSAFVSVPPGAAGSPYFPALDAAALDDNSTLYVEAFFSRGERFMRAWVDRGDGKLISLTREPVQDRYTEYEYKLYERACKLYPACPSDGYELMRFGRILSTTPTLSGEACATWLAMPFDEGKMGYIDVNQGAIKKLSDANFPFFMDWKKIEDGSTPFDETGLCGYDELCKLTGVPGDAQPLSIASVPTEFSRDESVRAYAQGKEEVRAKFRGFVCHAPSEWDARQNDARYQGLNEPDGFFGKRKDTDPDGYANFIEFVKKSQFVEQTSLSGQGKFWFFHPLAFIRHFRKCGYSSLNELARLYDERKYTSVGKRGAEYKEIYQSDLNKVLRKYSLDRSVRKAHFYGQCAIESYYMMITRECSMAIAKAIRENHISILSENAGYLRSPPARTSDVAYFTRYEGMKRLGNTDAGDGVKFRGRGFKQLTGRYNYAEYWVYRGFLSSSSFDHSWFNKSKPGPVIDNPEFVGNDTYTCVDTAGFFCARYQIAKAADQGVTEQGSKAVTRIVNAYDTKSPPMRWAETKDAFNLFGDVV